MSSQELIDIDLDHFEMPMKLEDEVMNNKKKIVKKSLILPKLAEENKRINFENMRMLKRILHQPISNHINSKQHVNDYKKHKKVLNQR